MVYLSRYRHMTKVLGILLALCLFQGVSIAQQDAQFTQFMFNPLYYNPASAGLSNGNTVTAIHRSQWFGYDGTINPSGAPTTQMVSYNTSSQLWNGGLGVHFVNDRLGPSSNLELQISGSYFIDLPGDASVSMGLKVGFFSSQLNFDDLVVVDPTDNLIISGSESQLRPDLGFGFLYRRGNFFGGLSANHVIQPEFDFGTGQISNQLFRHYYFNAGFDYPLTAQITLTPSVLIKSVGLYSYSWDIGVVAKYNDQFWGGIAYRQSESASLMGGYKLMKDQGLTLAYAVDLVLSDAASKEPTSQEVMLIYTFGSKNGTRNLGKNIIRTPRYRY